MAELQQALSAASNNSDGGVRAPPGVINQMISGIDNVASKGSLDRTITMQVVQVWIWK